MVDSRCFEVRTREANVEPELKENGRILAFYSTAEIVSGMEVNGLKGVSEGIACVTSNQQGYNNNNNGFNVRFRVQSHHRGRANKTKQIRHKANSMTFTVCDSH